MKTTREIQDEIIRLKKENDVCILVHAYQRHDIWEVADYVGDSFGLSEKAAESDASTVVMCGVRFMAETVKMLSPEKKVILSNPLAGCPMADQVDGSTIRQMKEANPNCKVVAYINTSAETKTECDVCVTSSSAVKIIEKMDADNILFIPDCNLGAWVESEVPGKNFIFMDGGCPVHAKITKDQVDSVKKLHPDALLLVHPECRSEVAKAADYIGSTTGIMKYAKESDAKEFIIGTENSIVEHLQYECPDKKFYPLSAETVCANMKLTTLNDVLECVKGIGGEEITLTEDTIKKARKPIDEMLRLG